MDYLVFSAPQPDLLPKYLALVYPLQLEVWICVVVSVVIFSFLFYAIARVEGLILSWTFLGQFELKMFLFYAWIISYSKCSNWHQILKLSLNFGCLFTCCYLQTCNLHAIQSMSYKSINQFLFNLPYPNSKT